ncbi:MAG: O-antigen ligase family protein [Armatimonadetes bacterium]|nr:O-antigen ligase family protein [Armatimonadota bacterium]
MKRAAQLRRVLATACVVAGAALLPLLGKGIPLDELPTPEVYAGRLLLGALFLLAILGTDPNCHDNKGLSPIIPLAAFWLVGLLGLCLARRGLVVGPTADVPFAPSYPVRFPADVEAGLGELARRGVVILALFAARRVRPGWVIGGLALGGAGEGLWALREYLLSARGGDPTWRVFGGFNNPNQLASYLLVLLAVAVVGALLADDDSGPARWLTAQKVARAGLKLRAAWIALALLVAVALALTGSRGGMLGIFAGVAGAVIGLLRRGRAAWWVIAAGLLLLVTLSLLGPVRTRLGALTAQSSSMKFRRLTWAGTVEAARAGPLLGAGLGGWASAYPPHARAGFTGHAHSGYLEVWTDTGPVGLALYLALFGCWGWLGWRAAGHAGRQVSAYGVGLLAAVFGFGLHNAFDHGWHVLAVTAALAMLGAAAETALHGARPAEPPHGDPGRGDRQVARVAGLSPTEGGDLPVAPTGGGRTASPQTGDLPAAPTGTRRWPVMLFGLAVLGLLLIQTGAERARAAGQAALRRQLAGTADERLKAAVRTAPWSSRAEEDLAGLLVWRGDRPAAERAFTRAIALRPANPRTHYRYAAALADWGRLDDALRESALATVLSPLHLQGWVQLGELLQRADRDGEALRVYRKMDQVGRSPALTDARAIEGYDTDPTYALGLISLGDLSAEAGDAPGARDAWTRGLAGLESYLKTFEREEALLKGLPGDERSELLEGRGLHAADRAKVVEQADHARQALAGATAGSAAAGGAPRRLPSAPTAVRTP